MKKIITIASVLVAFTAASASAKTEGSYIGLDLHRAVVKGEIINRTDPVYEPASENSATGLGVSYKYAFNFDKIFIAPGVFYERIGSKNLFADFENTETNTRYFNVNNRQGVRVDLGYDISDNFAAYVTTGLTRTGYSQNRYDGNGLGDQMAYSGKRNGVMYGFGMLSQIDKNISLGAEFNTQDLNVKNIYSYTGFADERTKSRIDMYKFTVAYHF